jgi:surface antigen Omp85-like protein
MRLARLLIALAVPLVGSAQEPTTGRETVQVLESRNIPRDVADDVSGVFNAPATTRLAGNQRVEAGTTLSGDIAIIEGTLTVLGTVAGRIVAINSTVVLESAARIDKDVTVIGGRLESRDGAVVAGDVRVYRDHVVVERTVDRIVVHDDSDDELWYRRRQRWRNRSWSDLRFLSAHTYNRVEGLPVLVGPAFGHEFGWGRLTLDALGIIRSVGSFEWTAANVGHTVKTEISLGKSGGLRFGGRLFDVVDAVEPWQLSDPEVGLASFLLHRDYRDYFDRHGGAVSGALFLGKSADLTLSFSDQTWGARVARNPFTLLRGGQPWRPNPQLDEGSFHILNATFDLDTRNDRDDPWDGWYVLTDYEFGTGLISRYGPSSPSVRRINPGRRTQYDRIFVDVRRYNRVSPDGQLNVRFVAGGWLSGDDLPLQRRFSVGGPWTLSGFDFRRIDGSTDYWHCSGSLSGAVSVGPLYPSGVPAQCDRIALGQVEYRSDIHVDPFGILNEERDRRRRGWGRKAQWVIFADAGRGWLVGPRIADMQYATGELPAIGSFRTDVGLGLRLDDIGLYVAKAVSDRDTPLNFFVRLRPRF